MPAREVVVFGNLVEAVLDVHGGHRELGGVDHTLFKRRKDVATRQQLGRHTNLLHDAGTETKESHLKTSQLLKVRDLFFEPAGCFRTNGETVDFLDAMLAIDFCFQCITTTELHPGHVFANRGAKRHRREERQGGVLTGVITGSCPCHFDGALGRCIKAFIRRY